MSSALPAVLAIDGGNSKTDIALVGADGTLLAGGRGPGVRTFPTPGVLAAIGAVIEAAALDARRPMPSFAFGGEAWRWRSIFSRRRSSRCW